jgi:guanylate kinase
MQGSLLVVSGPSGCGKSSLLRELIKGDDSIHFSVSTTTRQIRGSEVQGVDYYYVSKDEFQRDIEQNNFLEWAIVHNNYYGTNLKPIYKSLESGKLVVFDIDVQGYQIIKDRFSDILTSVFITTPSEVELKKRLENRGSDSNSVIETRLNNAKKEIEYINKYDYFIINDNFSIALQELKSVIQVSKIKKPDSEIKTFISKW